MNFQPLKDFMDNYLPMLGVPGTDIVIYKDHEEVFRYQSGFDSLRYGTPVNPNALYHMYSCTKVATCVAAVQLIERGEILATDPVYAYFPEFADIKVKHVLPDGTVEIRPAEKTLTIEHLLTMTGGLDYDLNRPGIKRVIEETEGRAPTLDIVRALAEDPFLFEPGTKYQYSLCLDVIGGIVELVSGMSLGEYLEKNIFEPLGMTETSFGVTEEKLARMASQYQFNPATGEVVEVPKEQNPFNFGTEYQSGGAGLISSVSDQILFADALANGGVGKNGNRILSKAGVELLSANHLPKDMLDEFIKGNAINQITGYGYGYGVRTNLYPAMGGNLSPVGEFGWDGARGSYFSCDPKNKVAFFYAEHMGGLHAVILPRLRNVVYSCLDL